MYIFASALLAFSSVQAQDSNDSLTFESINLNPSSYNNGSDGSGNFQINAISLTNIYDDTWGSWSGFSISNINDVTTPGYGNQYANFAGAGSNSENYAIFYPAGEITFSSNRVLQSLDVTNSTYAGISMRDGDAYGKQFGSPLNAQGLEDGTNGQDYFLLKIIPLDENDVLVGDTIMFYLADYRFEDDNDNYIIDTWETIDFTTNGILEVRKLKFELESSDNGDFGMNTPAYFALDNLYSTTNLLVESNFEELGVRVYPNPFSDELTIETNSETHVTLLNLEGKVLIEKSISSSVKLNTAEFTNGTYFLRVQSNNKIATQKIIK